MTPGEERAAPERIPAAAELSRPRLLAFLFCGYYTEGDGPPSVIDVVDYAYVAAGTEHAAGIGVYIKLAETPNGKVELCIFDPNGKRIGWVVLTTSERRERPDPDITNWTMRIGFRVPMEGTYFFAVYFNSKPLGGAPLTVRFVEQETADVTDRRTDAAEAGDVSSTAS